MPNLLPESSQKRLALSCEIKPEAPLKRIEPEVILERYWFPEIYRSVVEAVPETVKAVEEAYGKVEAKAVEVDVKYEALT